jgi:hypothetical protein
VTGAAMTGNSTNGINLSTATFCAVTGNTVYNNATATASDPEIYLNTTSTNNTITGNVVNSANAINAISEQVGGASTDVTVGPRYGTMPAPPNGASLTGTRFGLGSDALIRPATSSASRAVSTFACTDVITGLTPGTAYWLDVAVDSSNPANAAFIQNVSVSITELAN